MNQGGSEVNSKTKSSLLLVVCACVILAASVASFAQPLFQVQRSTNNVTLNGQCCFLFGSGVLVTEKNDPGRLVPVVVTFSADYNNSNQWVLAGLSINGGPCNTGLGPGGFEILNATNQFSAKTFQWVVLPTDGLHTGSNRFDVCGGGGFDNTAHITLGVRSLVVQIGK
jgi:hypothetical protein